MALAKNKAINKEIHNFNTIKLIFKIIVAYFDQVSYDWVKNMDFLSMANLWTNAIFIGQSLLLIITFRSTARQFSSGCQDSFAIFAFLAFLLTVLDL